MQPIEQIRADDVVKSYDEATQMNTWQRVVGAFQKTTEKLVRIIAGKDTLLATPEHPFYVREDQPDGSKIGNWTPASALQKGLKVLLASGMLASVDSLCAFDSTTTVYNFEVARTHTYYVGQRGMLVHNDCASFQNALNALRTGTNATDPLRFPNLTAIYSNRTIFSTAQAEAFAATFEEAFVTGDNSLNLVFLQAMESQIVRSGRSIEAGNLIRLWRQVDKKNNTLWRNLVINRGFRVDHFQNLM